MADPVQDVWQELAKQVRALGATAHQRYREAGAGPDEGALRSALDRLVAAGKEVGERIGDVAHDDAVREQARAASSSLDAAIAATVDAITDALRSVVRPGTHPDD